MALDGPRDARSIPAAPHWRTGLRDIVAAENGAALVLFALPGCEACVLFAEALSLARIPRDMGRVFQVTLTVDDEETRALCLEAHVSEFPSLVWFVDGAPYDVWAGFFTDPDPERRRSLLEAELSAAASARRGAADTAR